MGLLHVVLDSLLSGAKDNKCGDHFGIEATRAYSKLQNRGKEITFRRLREVSLSDVIEDIQPAVMHSPTDGTIDDLVEACNSGFKALRQKHLPLQRKNTALAHRGAQIGKT